ncbi:hypothetical protein MASR1M65_10750 [Saprospiraceae bacterium]
MKSEIICNKLANYLIKKYQQKPWQQADEFNKNKLHSIHFTDHVDTIINWAKSPFAFG